MRVYHHAILNVVVNKDVFSKARLEARQVVLGLLPLLVLVGPSDAGSGDASGQSTEHAGDWPRGGIHDDCGWETLAARSSRPHPGSYDRPPTRTRCLLLNKFPQSSELSIEAWTTCLRRKSSISLISERLPSHNKLCRHAPRWCGWWRGPGPLRYAPRLAETSGWFHPSLGK